MASNELDFQAEIVSDAKAAGGAAFKASHAWQTGVVDLSVKVPGYPHLYAECKWIKDRPKNYYTVKPTVKQQQFMEDYHAAGGSVAVLVGYSNPKPMYWSCLIFHPLQHPDGYKVCNVELDGSDDHTNVFVKGRGGKWPIHQIMATISNLNCRSTS